MPSNACSTYLSLCVPKPTIENPIIDQLESLTSPNVGQHGITVFPVNYTRGFVVLILLWVYYHVLLDSFSNAVLSFNTLRPRRTEQHFADEIFKRIFFNENVWITIKNSLKFVPKGPISNIPALVQIMAWRRPGDTPLSEPMLVSLPSHICVSRPQWVMGCFSSSVSEIALKDVTEIDHYQTTTRYKLANHVHNFPDQLYLLRLYNSPVEIRLYWFSNWYCFYP